MLDILFWVLVGALIGWHVPEPLWSKTIREKIMGWFKSN
jgi:hypothetical protein